MGRVEIRLLGGFEARPAGTAPAALPKKAQALLAYLALTPGTLHPRDKLATLLWGERADPNAQDSLRHALSAIRRAFPAPLLADGQGVALGADTADVDVLRFQEAVAAGTPDGLARAADLYRGDLLEGLVVDEGPFEAWLLVERERLRELVLEALARLVAHQTASGETDRAIRTAQRLLALDPLQEAGHRALMRLYLRQSRRGAALRQYQLCVTTLQRELAAEPEPETRRLYQEIVQHQPAPPERAPAEVPEEDTTWVGREPELSRFRQAFETAAAGRAQCRLVLGEAGIGKTRLVAELARHCAAAGARVLVGRAYESLRILPYGPWMDALRADGATQDLADDPTLGAASRRELTRLFPELIGPGTEPPADAEDHRRLFEALGRAIRCLAAPQPLVLVLEDLHWADETTPRLLAFLTRRLRDCRVLLVATAREDELDEVPALRTFARELAANPVTAPLSLGPLSRDETTSLVATLSSSRIREADLERLGAQVWRLSEGHPFVAVEVVRAMAEGAAPQSADETSLPRRVHELVASRIERATSPARELTAVAAVIGREFDFALLRRAAGLDERAAAECVEELVRRRVLHGVGERFEFAHDRIRQVVYAQVLAPRRALLHRQVAEALEDLYGEALEPHHAALARHCQEGGLWPKALRYVTRVAERAARSSAHEAALATLGEALAALPHLPAAERDRHRVDLALRQVRSLFFLGRFQETLALLHGHAGVVERLADPRLVGRYYFTLGNTQIYLGDFEGAAASARQAIAHAEACGDEATLGKGHYLLAYVSYSSGRAPEGFEHARRAIALLARPGEQWWLGGAYFFFAMNCYLIGDLGPALEALARTRAIAEALDDPRPRAWAAWGTGFMLANAGDWEAAARECRRALELVSDPVNTSMGLGFLGFALATGGHAADAIAPLEQAIDLSARFEVRQHEGFFLAFLADAHRRLGDHDRATALARRSVEMSRAAGFAIAAGTAQRTLGRLALDRADLAGAAVLLAEALETFSGISARLEMARTHELLAELCRRRGDGPDAERHAARAAALIATCRLPSRGSARAPLAPAPDAS